MAAVGLLALFEVVPGSQALHAMPDPEHNREWITWLQENTAEDTPIGCVPFASNAGVSGFVSSVDWMVLATYHRRPIANGYSGHFPMEFLKLVVAMQAFPDERSLELARGGGLEYLVVRRTTIDPARLHPDVMAAHGLVPVFDDRAAGVTIYRLTPGGGG
jgi:hypothetical protein